MNYRQPLPDGFRLITASSNYTVLGYHGSGGTALVYKAEDQRKRIFALKELYDNQLMERDPQTMHMRIKPIQQRYFESVRERWRAEFKTFSNHSIPGLVQFNDFVEANNTCYLLMRFVEGESLWDQVKARGPINVGSALKLIRSLGGTLEILHSLDIIHRDVKPDNVWVQKDGNPLLLDAGAARNFTTGSVRRTRLQTMLGAPELLSLTAERKYGSLGPATDVYALAGLFVYAITGRVPPRNVSDFTTAGTEDDPMHCFAMPVNTASRKVLTKALNVYVLNRYQSANEFLNELESAARSSTMAVLPPGRPRPINTFLQQTKRWLLHDPKSDCKTLPKITPSQNRYSNEEILTSAPTGLAVLATNAAAVALITFLIPTWWNIATLLVSVLAHVEAIRRCRILSQQLGIGVGAQPYLPILNFFHAKSLASQLIKQVNRSQRHTGNRSTE